MADPDSAPSPPLWRNRRGLMFAALPAIAVLAAVGVVLAWSHRDSAVADRRMETVALADAAAINARRFIDDELAVLAAVALSPVVREVRRAQLRPYLVEVAREGRFTGGLAYIDREGRALVASSRPPGSPPVDVSDRAYVQQALAGTLAVSDVLIGRTRGVPVIAFGYPVTSAAGTPGGALAGSVRLDQIGDAINRLLYAPGAGETILDAADNVIVGEQPVRGLTGPPRGIPVDRMRARERGVAEVDRDGETRLVAYKLVSGTDWLVLVERPYADVLGPLDTALWAEIFALAVLAALGVLVTFATAHRLDRLDRARDEALDEQRTIALRLQRSLLPDVPQPDGLDVQARYTPAQGAMAVGGDWYDVVEVDCGRVALSVGDVSGHGLGAAAVMGQLRSAVRALALGRRDPAEALTEIDRFTTTLDGRPLATMVYAVLDTTSGNVVYACAGHPPPFVLRAGGGADFLEAGRSPLLGVDPVEPRPEGSLRLAPGDTLVFFTDGLVERPEASIDEGLAALATHAAAARGDTASLADTLIGTPAEPRRDDAAVLCVRFLAQTSSVAS